MLICLSMLSQLSFGGCLKGNNILTEQKRELPPFNAIKADGAYTIRVKCGESQKVRISGDKNLLPAIETRVNNKTLMIDTKENICTQNDIEISLSLKELKGAVVNGVNEINISRLHTKKFRLHSGGSADVKISGDAEMSEFYLSGAADLKAEGFDVKDVHIKMDGAGTAILRSNGSLMAEIDGVGDVVCYGRPASVKKNIQGIGTLTFK